MAVHLEPRTETSLLPASANICEPNSFDVPVQRTLPPAYGLPRQNCLIHTGTSTGSVAGNGSVYGPIAGSKSVVTRVVTTENTTKPKSVSPKFPPFVKAPVVKATPAKTMKTAATETVGLRRRNARGQGKSNNSSDY
jgi:hypothetical protein